MVSTIARTSYLRARLYRSHPCDGYYHVLFFIFLCYFLTVLDRGTFPLFLLYCLMYLACFVHFLLLALHYFLCLYFPYILVHSHPSLTCSFHLMCRTGGRVDRVRHTPRYIPNLSLGDDRHMSSIVGLWAWRPGHVDNLFPESPPLLRSINRLSHPHQLR